MTFLISLIHHIETISVTQFIKQRGIRIVCSTDHINIGLFHQSQILFHSLPVHKSAGAWMMFMAIHSLQFNRLSIKLKYISINLAFPYSYM